MFSIINFSFQCYSVHLAIIKTRFQEKPLRGSIWHGLGREGRETIFTCPHTMKFRTRPLAGTASGMASDSVRGGAGRSSEVERSLMVRWVVGSILHGVDPLSYFSFQPVLHDWCNKGRGMCYPVCGMVHIKEPLLLIDKSTLCGGSGFPFSLWEWSLTICLTPYNRR